MKLSEENQKWLENKSYHSRLLNGHSVLNEDIEEKLLADQQRIQELEKENAELKAHSKKQDELLTIVLENADEIIDFLRESTAQNHVLLCADFASGSYIPEQSLAQHDKEVIEKFLEVFESQNYALFDMSINEIFECAHLTKDKLLEQLQEQG